MVGHRLESGHGPSPTEFDSLALRHTKYPPYTSLGQIIMYEMWEAKQKTLRALGGSATQ